MAQASMSSLSMHMSLNTDMRISFCVSMQKGQWTAKDILTGVFSIAGAFEPMVKL